MAGGSVPNREVEASVREQVGVLCRRFPIYGQGA
jgi:hypothetical protein